VRAQFFGISSRSNFFEHITFERSPQRCLTDVSVFHQSSTSFLFDRFHRIRIPRNDLLERSPQHYLIAFDRPSVFAKFPNSKYRLIDSQHEQRSPQYCLIAFDRPSVFAEFPNSKYRLIDSQHEQRSPQYCLIAFDRPSVFAEFPISKELYSDP
jgi:hypothetical protein